MKFHLIMKSRQKVGKKPLVIPGHFENACKELGVEYVEYDARKPEIAKASQLGEGDLLYRAAASRVARTAERTMIGPECTTFYTDWETGLRSRGGSYFFHKKAGMPVIPSVPFLPRTPEQFEEVAETLGGFPIIVKMLGGSRGVGVIRVDSMGGFRSLVDYIGSTNSPVLLRKYIEHDYYGRLVVVGDKVAASYYAYRAEQDFRVNAQNLPKRKRGARVFSEDVQKLAVDAVRILGIETGGVDILFDKDGKPHLTEVNFPHDFGCAQRDTGIDIAKIMVEHLMKKAQAKKLLNQQTAIPVTSPLKKAEI